jgi:hypothetical protein
MQAQVPDADAFVAQWKDLKLPDGRGRVVRHGHGPRRTIQTSVGAVDVRRPNPFMPLREVAFSLSLTICRSCEYSL